MIPEIGDKFIINWEKIVNIYTSVKICESHQQEFTIDSFSKSKLSVYFSYRKNKKCRCNYCKGDVDKYSVGVSDIIITQKKLQIIRESKLKELGI